MKDLKLLLVLNMIKIKNLRINEEYLLTDEQEVIIFNLCKEFDRYNQEIEYD
jgi:hypothetical protein